MPRKIPLRSWNEIRFRLLQELTNLRFSIAPPRLPARAFQSRKDGPVLPNPAEIVDRLKTGCFAQECLRLAEEVLEHRFPILGITVDTGREIQWRRDYATGTETQAVYFRRIPYLDVSRAGDHKSIWELNRHQHLVLLAQAYRFSGRKEYLEEIVRQLESWLEQNPFQRSVNWASALEVAFRALSWIWVDHLVGDHFEHAFRRTFLEGLYRHGLHLEVNLSYYFSPNTHLLGEAVALHAVGRLFQQFPHAKRWEETGARIVSTELDRQVLADGSHFELSTYYHVYAMDMFLFHGILRGMNDLTRDGPYREKLGRMARFLDSVLGPSDSLPYLGDDDGGRFFHPYGPRNRFGLATLATCGQVLGHPEWIRDERYLEEQAAWWLVAPVGHLPDRSTALDSLRFPDSGLVVMAHQGVQIVADAGPFGPGSAGHSHADTLSLVLRQDEEQILIDPGTYTYVGDRTWRERFRGTAAHNTVRIDGLDQAIPMGPFAWKSRPEVKVLDWQTSSSRDLLKAVCSYANLRHQRTIVFDKNRFWVVVIDRLEGESGDHEVEQFWHFGTSVSHHQSNCFRVGTRTLIALDPAATPRLLEGGDYGWISPALGVKLAATTICAKLQTTLPVSLTTLIDLSGESRTLPVPLDQLGLEV